MDSEHSFMDYSFINFAGTESLLSTSQYAKVIFCDIEEKYSLNEDLVCRYSHTTDFTPKDGDRIILFRLGWQDITDYEVFEWAAVQKGNEQPEVRFHAATLPNDLNEFYQLCYISSENAVFGASIPFQFSNNKKSNKLITTDGSGIDADSTTDSLLMCSNKVQHLAPEPVDCMVSESVLDIAQLREENKLLKQDLSKTTTTLKQYNSQIAELKAELQNLKSDLKVTQNDVANLKLRMDVATAERKNLYLEKKKVEKNFDKLLKMYESKRRFEAESELSVDALGELDPLPPFPVLK